MCAPASYSRRVFAMMRGIRATTCGGGTTPGIGTKPAVRPTATPLSTMRPTRSPGSSTPSALQNDTCSMPPTPASSAARIAAVPWACAVTGRPSRCASSTSARARRHRPAAGHHLDDVGAAIGPLACRRPQSGRLRRSSSAEEVAVARRRGDRRPGRDDRRQSGGTPPQPQPQREIVTVAEVANRREPS
jgi:hypothetical protein